MNATDKLTVKTKNFMKPHERFDTTEHVSYFLALCEVCHHNSKLAMQLVHELHVVTNRTQATTWQEVWDSEYSFADQVNSTYWEDDSHYEQAEAALKKLEETFSEGKMKESLIQERNYYLFPELNIAFCIDAEAAKEHGLKEPGEHILD